MISYDFQRFLSGLFNMLYFKTLAIMQGYHILYIIPEVWSQIIGPWMIMWHRAAFYRQDKACELV